VNWEDVEVFCPACGSDAHSGPCEYNEWREECECCGLVGEDCICDESCEDSMLDESDYPDYGPPGSGAVIIEYTGFEPGLERDW
jgi:hypothetical protein